MDSGRVAWREGMFLRPQHFQQLDRHIDGLVASGYRSLASYPWGLSKLKINADLAAIGKFGVEAVTGLMPDGLPFDAPGDLPAPAPIEVPADTRDALVFLTLPTHQPGAATHRSRDARGLEAARFLVDLVEVDDAYSTTPGRETIEIARPNLCLGLTREQTYGRLSIPLARIHEVRNGGLVLDTRHIPPCLNIHASTRLNGFVADILGRAGQRIDELAVRAVQAVDGGAETFASFLLLQALNRWEPELAHLHAMPVVHPERLYQTFAAMAGELATLTRNDRRAPKLGPYDHQDPQPLFEAVVEHLQAALSAVYDRSAVQLPLQKGGPGAYTARITDPALFADGRFYLAVSAAAPLEELRARFPAVAKFGPVQRMREIVDSALPGVPLHPAPVVPPQLRALAGFVYFELDRSTPAWAEFATAPALGLHVAGDWPSLKLELWGVRGAAR